MTISKRKKVENWPSYEIVKFHVFDRSAKHTNFNLNFRALLSVLAQSDLNTVKRGLKQL